VAQGQCSALRKFDLIGAITACLTWIKCADLQKRYPLKLGGVLPWCCIRDFAEPLSAWDAGPGGASLKVCQGQITICE
jgi:hypothetical protein